MVIDGLQDPYLTEKESESRGRQDQKTVTLMPRPRAPQKGWGKGWRKGKREKEGQAKTRLTATLASHSRELQYSLLRKLISCL